MRSDFRAMDVDALIERAKRLRGFRYDAELAEFLTVSRKSVANWRRRKTIPEKYLFAIVKDTTKSIDWLAFRESTKQNMDISISYDMTEIVDTLGSEIDALHAFAVMLHYAVKSGDDIAHVAAGAEYLLTKQGEELHGLLDGLQAGIADLRREKLKSRDLDDVARQSGVSREVAANIIFHATGISLLQQPEQAGEADHA